MIWVLASLKHKNPSAHFLFSLEPIRDIHLHSNTKYELEPNGDIHYVYIFSALAVFILLLACINFTNLSTASAVKRSREVGIRKVMGSLKKQLIFQFLTESVLLTFLALICAYIFVFLLLPYFNHVSGKNISFSFFLVFSSVSVIVLLSILVGILAGIYPSFYLSSFNPIKVLKGSSSTGSGKNILRNGLVIFQFFVSITLIIATIIVYQQLHYMQNKKLGYDKEQVLYLPDAYLLGSKQDAFKQRFDTGHAGCLQVSYDLFPVLLIWMEQKYFLKMKTATERTFTRIFIM